MGTCATEKSWVEGGGHIRLNASLLIVNVLRGVHKHSQTESRGWSSHHLTLNTSLRCLLNGLADNPQTA